MDDEAIDKPLPEREKPDESHAQSSTAQGHEVVPDPGVTGLITQMETTGTVEKDSVGHEVGSETRTAEITPNLNEVMETCMSEQDRDQHPESSIRTVEKGDVVPESGTAEISLNQNEEMETSVSEQNGDQCADTEKRTGEKDTDTVKPVFGGGGGGSLALLSIQYRDESSDELSER